MPAWWRASGGPHPSPGARFPHRATAPAQAHPAAAAATAGERRTRVGMRALRVGSITTRATNE